MEVYTYQERRCFACSTASVPVAAWRLIPEEKRLEEMEKEKKQIEKELSDLEKHAG